MKRVILAAAILAVIAATAAGCGGSSKSSSGGASTGGGGGGGGKKTIAGVQANDHGSKSVTGGEAEVEVDDFYFEPTVLKGKPGTQVTLELKNEGSTEHNFTIDSQGIDKDVEAGEDAKVSVTLPKSGELSFYCKYHKSMGMAGALAVGGSGGMTGGGGGGTTTQETSTGKGY
jgi:plastocyanin